MKCSQCGAEAENAQHLAWYAVPWFLLLGALPVARSLCRDCAGGQNFLALLAAVAVLVVAKDCMSAETGEKSYCGTARAAVAPSRAVSPKAAARKRSMAESSIGCAGMNAVAGCAVDSCTA